MYCFSYLNLNANTPPEISSKRWSSLFLTITSLNCAYTSRIRYVNKLHLTYILLRYRRRNVRLLFEIVGHLTRQQTAISNYARKNIPKASDTAQCKNLPRQDDRHVNPIDATKLCYIFQLSAKSTKTTKSFLQKRKLSAAYTSNKSIRRFDTKKNQWA